MTGPLLGPAARAAATEADRRTQLDDGLIELACRQCGGRVRAGKRNAAHTSIQWTADATRRCSAYAVAEGCRYLRATVEGLSTGDEDRPVPLERSVALGG